MKHNVIIIKFHLYVFMPKERKIHNPLAQFLAKIEEKNEGKKEIQYLIINNKNKQRATIDEIA